LHNKLKAAVHPRQNSDGPYRRRRRRRRRRRKRRKRRKEEEEESLIFQVLSFFLFFFRVCLPKSCTHLFSPGMCQMLRQTHPTGMRRPNNICWIKAV
jgi:hypothetical protein